jgi:Heterokaryon incompatibility protein (HET)
MAQQNYRRVRKTFQYQPLVHDPENPMIRVLELLPGSLQSPIRCYLRHVSLSDHLEYEALSYCWGSTVKPKSIMCSTSVLKITEALSAALIRLRLYNRSRCLWVDAICINQEDDDEMSYQIGLMGKIYQSAKSVIVWLGGQAEQSELLEDLVPVLLEAKRKKAAANDERMLREMTARDLEYYGVPHWIYNGGYNKYFSLCRIASRPWFSRVWVIQEISLAADAVVYCGAWGMPWSSLVEAVDFVQEIAHDIFHGLSDGQNMQVLQWSRARVSGGAQQNLLSLLLRHQSAQATNPKDKIYGLLGLASDSCVVEVKSSNSYSFEEVCTDVARALLEKGRNLDVLSVAHLHTNVSGEYNKLPSWVPDWSLGSSAFMPLLQQLGNEGLYLDFQAASKIESYPVPQVDGNLLRISGHIVDDIIDCGPVFPLPPKYDVYSLRHGVQAIFKALEEDGVLHHWEKVAQARSEKQYITGGAILDAYWHTLCILSSENEELARLFIAYDNFRGLTRSLNILLLDTLGLDYGNWPFKLLSLICGLTIAFFRILVRALVPNLTFPSLMVASRGRKMVRTRKGYIGLVSQFVAKGDKIGLFPGSKVPLIIRYRGPHWQSLGEAYIHGMMHGECFVKGKCRSVVFC